MAEIERPLRRGPGRPRKVPTDAIEGFLDLAADKRAKLNRYLRERETLFAMFRVGEAGIRLPGPWTDAN